MITQVVCLNYVSKISDFPWADVLVCPNTPVGVLWLHAGTLPYQSPVCVSLPPGECVPLVFAMLSSLWRDLCDYNVPSYTVVEDPRCSTPKSERLRMRQAILGNG